MKMVSGCKQLYKGKQLFSGTHFEADDSDVDDMIAMGLARPMNKDDHEYMTKDETVSPRRASARGRGRYNRTDMRAEDE